MQKVSAMYLRKVICLQQGDLEGAERRRKQAELLALQSSTRQMFTSLLMLEVGVHYAVLDLAGVKQLAEKIAPLAARNPGWVTFQHLAEGHYQRLRGDLEAALHAYERCLALATPDPNEPTRSIAAWPMAAAAHVDTLVRLDRAAEAEVCAKRALAECERRELGATSHEIIRALALAEAKLGDYAKAASRLDALLEVQRALGVSGLNLGASYEARTRVAIWAGDHPGVERFARLTADQYRHGRGSPLGVRYERLMGEARGAGVTVLPALTAFESTMFGNTEISTRGSVIAMIAESMIGAHDADERGARALRLLCKARGAQGGHLFLGVASELRLAASYAADPPDAALERAVSDFWSHQSDDSDPDTAQVSDGTSAHGYSTLQWTDLRGTTYQPVLVSGKVGKEIVNAGVALLIEHDNGAAAATSMPLVAELAGFLVRSSLRPR
jgi:tetratricopeptide (TPR) repeat protein